MLEERAVDVSEEMVDADDGLAGGGGESLGVGVADEERGDETGVAGDGDGVDVVEGGVGLGEGLVDDGADVRG